MIEAFSGGAILRTLWSFLGTYSNTTCDANHFPCVSSRFNIDCIPKAWLCDLEEDCDNGMDEGNCTEVTCSSVQVK